MAKIILDCDLMKHRNSGLYQYCLNIGNAVNRLLEHSESKDKIRYYTPESEAGTFDVAKNSIIEKKIP